MSERRHARALLMRSARERAGLTQQQVADAVLPSRRMQTISDWEKGKGAPRGDKLTAMSELLGFSLNEYHFAGGTPTVREPAESYVASKEWLDGKDSIVRGSGHVGLGTRVEIIIRRANRFGWGRQELLSELETIRDLALKLDADLLDLYEELRRRDREAEDDGDP